MNRIKRIIIILLLCLIATGCSQAKEDSDLFETNENDNILYSFGCEWNTQEGKDECNVQCTVINEGYEFDLGILAFLNGIPQELNGSNYINTVHVDTKTKDTFSMKFKPSSYTTEAASVRYITMLEPKVIYTEDENYYVAFNHKLGGSAMQDTIIEKNLISVDKKVDSFDGTEVETNAVDTVIKLKFNDILPGQSVVSDDFVKGILSVELGSGDDMDYILSFWGDCNPIELGGSRYVKVHIDKNQVKQIEFEINDELTNYNNFFAIICPVSYSKYSSIVKTSTLIIKHSEEETVETDETTYENMTTQGSDNSEEFSNGYEIIGKIKDKTVVKSLTMDKDKSITVAIIDNEENLVEKLAKIRIEDFAFCEFNCIGEGVIVEGINENEDEIIYIYNENLEERYYGSVTELINSANINSTTEVKYIFNNCVYVSAVGSGDIIQKNLLTNDEELVYSSELNDIEICKLRVVEGSFVYEFVKKNGSEESQCCLYNKQEINQYFNDCKIGQIDYISKKCILYANASIEEVHKDYMFLLDINTGELTKVKYQSEYEM